MKTLIVGGAGFVGLNIAAHMLAQGDDVTIFDRSPCPEPALRAWSRLPGTLRCVAGDVTDRDAVAAAMSGGPDVVVMGAAITAGSSRDASDPETILAVNLLAQTPVITAAREAGVRRIVNLSSAAAYGAAGEREPVLDETTPGDPVGLYAITKWASERVGRRLASLWGLDLVSLRLSGVFGPWERATGVRDTLSPHCQVLAAALAGEAALLPRPGLRDWIFAPDVAQAVRLIAGAPTLPHDLYNVSAGERTTVLAWGEALSGLVPGFVCRLAGPGETATIDLHSASDRAPLATGRLARDLDWRATTGLAESVAGSLAWARGDRGESR